MKAKPTVQVCRLARCDIKLLAKILSLSQAANTNIVHLGVHA